MTLHSFADILHRLNQTIETRKAADPAHSYVARMMSKGRLKIAQKVGEEAVELSLAAVAEEKPEIVSESADLLFHLLLLWKEAGISLEDIGAELERRENKSGIEEKKSRNW